MLENASKGFIRATNRTRDRHPQFHAQSLGEAKKMRSNIITLAAKQAKISKKIAVL
jgi:hypothetical protein